MGIFKRKNPSKSDSSSDGKAEMILDNIRDGVIITDKTGVVEFINPAAIRMTECGSAEKAKGLDYELLLKMETKEGRELSESENRFIQSMRSGRPLEGYQLSIISKVNNKRTPVSISVLTAAKTQNRIITLRDITRELTEEGEKTEFISTASHEMRTPIATIDGYISLALNPQTASIDSRARGYLVSAHAAAEHLGKLFRDLLDITKLDDGKIRPHFEPTDMTNLVKEISDSYADKFSESKLKYQFGPDSNKPGLSRRMEQIIYGYVDVNFMREILSNLIENAIKYTPAGGSVYVNLRGDGDKTLINVTDTGIGISAEDIGHIFQKFYRADNSDTRTIGGTGLGLYIVKQRVEAMGGKVWAESAFGEGTTFYVSLPRISSDEYEKRMIAARNQKQHEAEIERQRQAGLQASRQAEAPGMGANPVVPAAPTAPASSIPPARATSSPTSNTNLNSSPIPNANPGSNPVLVSTSTSNPAASPQPNIVAPVTSLSANPAPKGPASISPQYIGPPGSKPSPNLPPTPINNQKGV